MNDLDRAQDVEMADRELCLKRHQLRPRPKATEIHHTDGSIEYRCTNASCDETLPAHRVEFGLCIECARAAEQRDKHFSRT